MWRFNYFNNKINHEAWFASHYLKSLGLQNKIIRAGDFEGIIVTDRKDELALFELKLITLPHFQAKVNEKLGEYEDSEYLHEMPYQEEMTAKLYDKISEAIKQLLSRDTDKELPRIIFLIRNSPDFDLHQLIDAIKSERSLVVSEEGKLYQEYGSELSDNKEVLDLFSDQKISGLILLTIDSEQPGYTSEIIINRNAKITIPDIFLEKAKVIEKI